MTTLIGLGNPGDRYKNTRHNIGWILLDKIFPDTQWSSQKYAQADIAQVVIDHHTVQLVKPQTFMNESGVSAGWLCEHNELIPEDTIVIYDDIDLPLGTWKLSFDRWSGGHNGIKSLEQHLGTREFLRLRIGISTVTETGDFIKPNVLGNFTPDEQKSIETMIIPIRTIITTYLEQGKEKAMTYANTKNTR